MPVKSPVIGILVRKRVSERVQKIRRPVLGSQHECGVNRSGPLALEPSSMAAAECVAILVGASAGLCFLTIRNVLLCVCF